MAETANHRSFWERPRFPLKGSFQGDVDRGIDIEMDINVDMDMDIDG